MTNLTAVLPVATPITQVTPLQTQSTPQKLFCQLCIEDLSEEKIAILKSTARWQYVACVTIVVGYLALSVGVSIAIGVLAPAYLPIASLTLLLGADRFGSCAKTFHRTAQYAEGEISKYQNLQHIYQDLTAQPPATLQLTLIQMSIGIDGRTPETLRSLTPLIAQAKFLNTQIQGYIRDKQVVIDKANLLETQDPVANREEINEYRRAVLKTENGILHAKIQAAFTNAVLRKPDTRGTLNDLGTVSTLTYEDRLLQNAANNATVNTFVEFRNPTIAPITVADVKTMTIAQLGERLFAAMTTISSVV